MMERFEQFDDKFESYIDKKIKEQDIVFFLAIIVATIALHYVMTTKLKVLLG